MEKERTLNCFAGFRCIAGACKDSCCVGWEIDVDEESFRRYQQLSGPFGERLRSSIATEEDGTHHYILQTGDRCPFLNEEGLCQQILICGEGILCEICAQHPRFFRMVGEVKEWGVGLACPEAARLLLSSEEKLCILEDETAQQEDAFLDYLLQVRQKLIRLAQREDISLHQRLRGLLELAGTAQEQMDWGEPAPQELEWLSLPSAIPPALGAEWLEQLTELEAIDDEWSEALADSLRAVRSLEQMEEFAEQMKKRQWEYTHLLVYLLFRYVLKAYEDEDLLYWVEMAVWSVLTVEMLGFGRWLKQQKAFSRQDQEDIFRIFSKEVEYDPEILENLDRLMEALEQSE